MPREYTQSASGLTSVVTPLYCPGADGLPRHSQLMDAPKYGAPRRPNTKPPTSLAYTNPQWAESARPLSEIRETTEPNLQELLQRRSQRSSVDNERDPAAPSYQRNWNTTAPFPTLLAPYDEHHPFPSPPLQDDLTGHFSIFTIPGDTVPPRASSKGRSSKRSSSLTRAASGPIPAAGGKYGYVNNTSSSTSPVKHQMDSTATNVNNGGIRLPSKTIIKSENTLTNSILDSPISQHPRVRVDLLVAAPLFVGGSSVEGSVQIVVDELEHSRRKRTLSLVRVSVDLLGVEEVSGSRRHVFIAYGNELVDVDNPPPSKMINGRCFTTHEKSWILVPSISVLPFLITLPLEVGPPPFNSKIARIKYVLSATLAIKDDGRLLRVRCSQDTAVLSVFDPEKALATLPSPLTATEEVKIGNGASTESVVVTAGLHRQVWVSGTTLFVDIHINNRCHQHIKKLELQVERIILCYRHAPASTLEMSASSARLFDQQDRAIIARSCFKVRRRDWSGVLPSTSLLRTCHLDIPRDHATIKCIRYFEVRYYLNVVVQVPHTKASPVKVQLPILLIHMNSLDVPTNAVAQVAAAIEETRSRHSRRSSRIAHRRTRSKARHPTNTSPSLSPDRSQRTSHAHRNNLPGRAFAAPRTQSLERTREQHEEIADLTRALDESPRKKSLRSDHSNTSYQHREEKEQLGCRLPQQQQVYTGSPIRNRLPFDAPHRENLSSEQRFRTSPSAERRRGIVVADDEASYLRNRLAQIQFADEDFAQQSRRKSYSPSRNRVKSKEDRHKHKQKNEQTVATAPSDSRQHRGGVVGDYSVTSKAAPIRKASYNFSSNRPRRSSAARDYLRTSTGSSVKPRQGLDTAQATQSVPSNTDLDIQRASLDHQKIEKRRELKRAVSDLEIGKKWWRKSTTVVLLPHHDSRETNSLRIRSGPPPSSIPKVPSRFPKINFRTKPKDENTIVTACVDHEYPASNETQTKIPARASIDLDAPPPQPIYTPTKQHRRMRSPPPPPASDKPAWRRRSSFASLARVGGKISLPSLPRVRRGSIEKWKIPH